MKRLGWSVCLVVAAAGLALPTVALDGKGGDKGGGKGNGSSKGKKGDSAQSTGPGKSEPARPFDHPKSGNSLPQEVRDRLPPGLRDRPVTHPGLANHLGKMGWTVGEDGTLVPPATSVVPPARTVTTLPPEVRDRLPPGLRDRPITHPGVANHLGKMGWTIADDGTLVPPSNFVPPPTKTVSSLPLAEYKRLPVGPSASAASALPQEVREQLPSVPRA